MNDTGPLSTAARWLSVIPASDAMQRIEDNSVLSDPSLLLPNFVSSEKLGAFLSAVAMIVVSEAGDKTFFIAALMSMRFNALTVFAGSIAALGLMTVLSSAAGYALPMLFNRSLTSKASVVLFALFGVKMLLEARQMDDAETAKELAEVEAELDKKDDKTPPGQRGSSAERFNLERCTELTELPLGPIDQPGRQNIGSVAASSNSNEVLEAQEERECRGEDAHFIRSRLDTVVCPALKRFVGIAFIQAFSLTFVAEWGDRSQVATIAMASAKDPIAVTIGALLGHAICTGVAVVGGRILAARISEKFVSVLGGLLFLLFAGLGLLFDF